jgi:hypothetical protein
MNSYKFLLKPLIFIFNLLFATWLVFRIEQVSPTDLGMTDRKASANADPETVRKKFRQLCIDFKTGRINSTQLEQEFDHLIQDLKIKGK